MAKTPIIILAGKARSGKDTVGKYIADNYSAACVAQADPMKRFARDVFGFSEDALWGPSEARDPVDPNTVVSRHEIDARFHQELDRRNEVLNEVVPGDRLIAARAALRQWFEGIYRNSLCNEIPVSPRLVLQTFGTEWGRLVSRDMWSHHAIRTAEQLLQGGVYYTRGTGLIPSNHRGFDYAVITDGRFRNEILNVSKVNGGSFRIDRPGVPSGAAGGVSGHSSETLDIPDHFVSAIIQNDGDLPHLYDEVDTEMSLTFNDGRSWDLTVLRGAKKR